MFLQLQGFGMHFLNRRLGAHKVLVDLRNFKFHLLGIAFPVLHLIEHFTWVFCQFYFLSLYCNAFTLDRLFGIFAIWVDKLVNTMLSLFCYCRRQHSIINKHRQISMSHLLVKYQIIIIVVITRITVSVSIVVFLTRVRDRRTVVLQRQQTQTQTNKQTNKQIQVFSCRLVSWESVIFLVFIIPPSQPPPPHPPKKRMLFQLGIFSINT